MINEDPVFADTLLNLTELSPGIDMGITEATCHGQTWEAPPYDIGFLLRPDPWSEEVDMGAHEHGSIPWTGITEKKVVSLQSSVVSYPNPFSNFTTFEYELEQSAKVNLSIYNHLGQQVAVLVDGEQAAGRQQVQWEAEGLPSGIYFYHLTAGNQASAGKMVVVK